MSRRFQFSVKTMLWVMALVGALLGGREIGVRQERQGRINKLVAEQMELRDDQLRLRNQLQWLAQEQTKLWESEKQATERSQEFMAELVEMYKQAFPNEDQSELLRFEGPKSQKRSPRRRLLEETLDKVDGQPRQGRAAAHGKTCPVG